jgi:hypothetical protein
VQGCINKKMAFKKKSQMKMLESIFVLIIFFFMLIFGIIFYVKYQNMEGQNRKKDFVEIKLMEIATRIQNLPEIQCTKDGKYSEFDCVDLHKINFFKDNFENYNSYYSKIFSSSFINITQVYPSSFNYEIYSKDKTNSVRLLFLPVNIYNASSDQYNFGYITIGVYIK